jgi:phosphopantetheine adenylyltransferase
MRTPALDDIRKSAATDARGAYKLVIDRARKRGEIALTVNIRLMTDMLISPFLYQRLIENTKARKREIRQVIDAVIAAFGN